MWKRVSVKYVLFLSSVNESWVFSTDFREKKKESSKCQIASKSVEWEPSCFTWTDRQTDVTKLIVAFCNLRKRLKRNSHLPFCWSRFSLQLFNNVNTHACSPYILSTCFIINPTMCMMCFGVPPTHYTRDTQGMVGGGGRCLTYVLFELLKSYTIDDKRTKYECQGWVEWYFSQPQIPHGLA